jgi:Kef-type K+ transport system membrane component KefB
MRKKLTSGLVLAGIALMVVGFLGAAPWGASNISDSDPRLPFAPLLFVIGIITLFSAAIVYELLPDKRR